MNSQQLQMMSLPLEDPEMTCHKVTASAEVGSEQQAPNVHNVVAVDDDMQEGGHNDEEEEDDHKLVVHGHDVGDTDNNDVVVVDDVEGDAHSEHQAGEEGGVVNNTVDVADYHQHRTKRSENLIRLRNLESPLPQEHGMLVLHPALESLGVTLGLDDQHTGW